MEAKKIIEIMEKHYPLSLQEEWDKCGLQIGDQHIDVHKVMISLNADLQSLDEAIKQGCQMLITHHPFLLDPLINIDKDTMMGSFIYKAIENHIVVYSSHTALDRVSMNKWLIEKLGVHDTHPGDESGISQMATLNTPLTMNDFINHVQDVYQLNHFKYAGKVEMVKKVAICGGSGAGFMSEMFDKVDAYLTGDTKYHQAAYAMQHNLLLVDINHHIEQMMIPHLKKLLEKEIDVEIIEGYFPDYYTYR